MHEILINYKSDAISTFRSYKSLAERSLAQVDDGEFFVTIGPESNSLAILVKHIAGNLRSRFTDFLSTDGEKPDRNRDTEFEIISDSREELMDLWENGWKVLFETLDALEPEVLGESVTIRGEPHTVVEALNRQMTHYAYHVGQIVLLAKNFRGKEWKTLSVPKGKSEEFRAFMEARQALGDGRLSPIDGPARFLREEES